MMNMNVKFHRNLAFAALVCVVAPATAAAIDRDGPALGSATTYPAVASDQAIEAQRLAHQAAALAERAAALAAESRSADSASASDAVISDDSSTAREAADIQISDDSASRPPAILYPSPSTSTTSATSGAPVIGWRGHRTSADAPISFSDPSQPAAATAAPKPKASASSDDFDLKLSEAARMRSGYADNYASTIETTKPSTKRSTRAAAPPQPLKVDSIRLAAQAIADTKVKTADSEETLPPGNIPSDDSAIRVDGEPCGCMEGDCCPPPCPLFWTAGVEATFLRPDLNEGSANFALAEYAYDRFDEYSTTTDDVNGLYISPRIWIGVQGCLWGVNARYWHLRAAEGSYDPTLGSDGQWDGPNCGTPDFGYDSCNDLEAYDVDLEVTRRFCLHDCWMQFSAGVRHAELESNSSLNAAALSDDAAIFGFANAHRASRGTGIVLGWYGRQPILSLLLRPLVLQFPLVRTCGARPRPRPKPAPCSRSSRPIRTPSPRPAPSTPPPPASTTTCSSARCNSASNGTTPSAACRPTPFGGLRSSISGGRVGRVTPTPTRSQACRSTATPPCWATPWPSPTPRIST